MTVPWPARRWLRCVTRAGPDRRQRRDRSLPLQITNVMRGRVSAASCGIREPLAWRVHRTSMPSLRFQPAASLSDWFSVDDLGEDRGLVPEQPD